MIDEPNCANGPCKTCQWKDTCDRYIAWLDFEPEDCEDEEW